MRAYLLDTNLLLLWLVARTDPEMVNSFKRVQSFDHGDVLLLDGFLGDSPIVTTPHVLAEVSNFVGQAPPRSRPRLLEEFRRFALDRAEVYEEAKRLALHPGFSAFGLADTGLFSLAATRHIVTVDYRLAGKILAAGFQVTNFNHLRAASYR